MSRYEEINNKIIEMLEQGIIPWKKPWFGVLGGTFNVVSGRSYNFFNSAILSRAGAWGTFKNWKDLGGKIKKGTKAETAYSWGMKEVEEINEDGETVKKKIWFLKPWFVFHIDDVEIDRSKIRTLKQERKFKDIKVADDLAEFYVKREGIKLNLEKGDRAFYRPSTDSVTVPVKAQFKDSAEFYSTLFHELIHSTGSKERCNRVGERTAEAFFGNEEYSKEELVAELGAVGILNDLNIGTEKSVKNSAAYCQSWLKPLKNDKTFFVRAASRAEKAIQFLYGDFDFEEYHMDETEEPKTEKPKKTTKKKTETKKVETVKAEPKKTEKVKTAKTKTETKKTKKAEGKKTETKKAEKPKTTKKVTTKKAEEKAETVKETAPKKRGRAKKAEVLTKEAQENIKGGYKFIVGGYIADWRKGNTALGELPTMKEIREDLYDAVTRNLYKDGKEIGKKAEEMMKVFRKDAIVAEIERLLKADKTAKKLFATT